MIYCEACRRERDWPEGFIYARGCCELCGMLSICHDLHHSRLPDPKHKEKPDLAPG